MALLKKLISTAALVAALAPAIAFAGPQSDVKDFSNNTATEYFVDTDANKYNAPYYRGASEDWGWTHGALAGAFTSITLTISAFDVDSPAEVDNIYAWDGGAWYLLGALTGVNDTWSFGNTFDLSGYSWAEAQVNAGLRVRMDIDANNTGWIVTLGKSVLDVDGGTATCVPAPGVPCTNNVPEPGELPLVALALGAVYVARRVAKR